MIQTHLNVVAIIIVISFVALLSFFPSTTTTTTTTVDIIVEEENQQQKQPHYQKKERFERVVDVAPSLDNIHSNNIDGDGSISIRHPNRKNGQSQKRRNRRRDLIIDKNNRTTSSTVSPYFQFETQYWHQRNIVANMTLDLNAFEIALQNASENQCGLGITATMFDSQAKQIFQSTVGTNYHNLSATAPTNNFRNVPWVSGWTGNTTFALYSNSKIFVSILFMAAVVETGFGYLDEPMYNIFDYLSPTNKTGRITPRMILSHRTGIQPYNRNAPTTDPLYSCIANTNTTLEDCIQDHLLNDNVLENEPGTYVRYSNDPFYIMASILVKKTRFNNIDEIMYHYINEKLDLTNDTSYDCPLVGSTINKPHVSWGICSTGYDMAKVIQSLMRATDTTAVAAQEGSYYYNGTNNSTEEEEVVPLVVSPTSLKEIFSFQIGIADNADEPLSFNMPLSNCLSRIDDGTSINFLIGYGLGTMITAGVKGILFVHAATVGGYWVISPGKYAAYFAFMKTGAFPSAYAWIARIIDRFERASSVFVGNAWDTNDESDDDVETTKIYPNEVTPCIDGMFLDTTVLDDAVTTWENCPTTVRRRLHKSVKQIYNSIHTYISQKTSESSKERE